jgi:hypothetical protein
MIMPKDADVLAWAFPCEDARVEFMYGGHTTYFTRIAVDALADELSTKSAVQQVAVGTSPKYRKLMNLHYKWLSSYFICLIFSTFALESYINGYGVRKCTAKYFTEYLEKLSIEAKWIVIPRLATGISIYGSKGHVLLKKLIKVRNRLAHDKPKYLKTFDREDVETALIYYGGIRDISKEVSALDAVQTMIELDTKLQEIDEANVFRLADPYLRRRWTELDGSNSPP